MRRWRSPFAVVVLACVFVASPKVLVANGEDTLPPEIVTFEALIADLNLGFEASDRPKGWMAGGQGYRVVIDEDEVHAGKRSLRMAFLESGRFATATSSFPADTARGRRLRLIGYIRTEGITDGYAGLWMRVDGPDGVLAFDNMYERGISGTTDWTRYEIELDVAEEATSIFFGALLTGNGTAWVDSHSFELLDQAEPPPMITIRGVVTGPDGAAVSGAHVALNRPYPNQVAFRARSGPQGRFSVEVAAGEYAVTTTARGLAAAYTPPAQFGPEEAARELLITLDKCGFTIGGTVTDETGRPVPGISIIVTRVSDDFGDIFYSETDVQGRYELSPVAGESFIVNVESDGYVSSPVRVVGGGDRSADLSLVRLGPAPDEVVAWIKAHAIPLKTAEAENGFEDMRPLKELVGDARVVALGEATHGSREFFQLKHRFLEFLVEELGFSVFAIEANWPECLAINDYVVGGEGDAKEALAGIYFWTWNTEEVLEQIEWMRRYNVDPSHETKLKFYGFDMQTPKVAARGAAAYLVSVDPELTENANEEIVTLMRYGAFRSLENTSEEDQRVLSEGIVGLLDRFDEYRVPWIEKSDARQWELARQKVVLLQQALEMETGGGSNARDKAMAANLEWILETEAPGTRIVVWAHNGHVSRNVRETMRPMGSHLDGSLGADYVVLGFAFNQGSFQAIDWTKGRGKGRGLSEHTVGPAPEGNTGAALARADLPIFVLDLRQLPSDGPVANWFRVPHPMRQIGAVFQGEQKMSYPIVLENHFDAVIFVNETTRARPVK